MPTPNNKAVVHRWFEEVWNQGREATIDELFATDGVTIGLGESDVEVRGPSQFKTFFYNLRTAFPDLHITIEDTLAEGEKVAVRLKIEGTHKGEGIGLSPTGRRISIAGIVIIRFADGKFVEAWNSWDQLGMLRQIGVIPAAENDRFLAARG
jgi:steroid delta-isomerase-like uncharacterized protein